MRYYNIRSVEELFLSEKEFNKLTNDEKMDWRPYQEGKVNFVNTSKYHDIKEYKPKQNSKLGASRYE